MHNRSVHTSVHALSCVCVCVCVPAQLKVNSVCLGESTLKSGGCGASGRERGGRPIPG